MPTIDQSASLRVKHDIVLRADTERPEWQIDVALHAIINEKFPETLKITKLSTKAKPNSHGQATWIVASKDPDYIFGFRVVMTDNIVQVKSGVNTWSMWAEDCTRHMLAEKLKAQFKIETKLVDPGKMEFDDLASWMEKFKVEAKMDTLPSDFKRAAGIK